MSTHAEVSPVTATLTWDTVDIHTNLPQQRMEGLRCIPKRNLCHFRRCFNSLADALEPSVRNSLEFLVSNNSSHPRDSWLSERRSSNAPAAKHYFLGVTNAGQHFDGIDAIRGLCIMNVVLHHTNIRIAFADSPVGALLPKFAINALFWTGVSPSKYSSSCPDS